MTQMFTRNRHIWLIVIVDLCLFALLDRVLPYTHTNISFLIFNKTDSAKREEFPQL